MKTLTLLLVSTLLTTLAVAGDFTLAWSTIGDGAGLSASADGRFALHSSAGQPDAGAAREGRFALEGGHWNSVHCAYGLTIARFVKDTIPTRPTFITVSWMGGDLGDCLLETTTELRADPRAIVWTAVTFRRVGDLHFYSTEATGAARFFRLRQ